MLELARKTRFTSALPQHSRAARALSTAKTAALLAPFGMIWAGAQDTDGATQLANAAKSQMTGLVALLVGILVVGIGITVLFFANKNTKKGVKTAG